MSTVKELKEAVAKKTKGDVVTDSDYVFRDKSKPEDAKNTIVIEGIASHAEQIKALKAEMRGTLGSMDDIKKQLMEEIKAELKAEMMKEAKAEAKGAK